MDIMPRGYHVDESTWFYLSSLLIVAVFFRFHRVFSLRNLDLGLLLASGTGILLVRDESPRIRLAGFAWLFSLTAIYLVRLLGDSLLKRRPPLAQNLNSPGMAFLCVSAFVLLTMQAISSDVQTQSTRQTQQEAADLLTGTDRSAPADSPEPKVEAGRTPTLIYASVELMFEDLAPRVMSMLAHLAVIVGLLFVGRNLFRDVNLGLAMATLYLLLPCTAYDVREFNYVLPAALIVWTLVAYQKPVVAGLLMGLACGAMFFPLFLVPLWVSFYGRRGGVKFVSALSIVAAALLASYALTSADPDSFWQKTMGTIQLTELSLKNGPGVDGFWGVGEESSPYRFPVIVAYFVLTTILTIWPRHKNVEHLMAWSAILIVGTQFWYPQQGGVYLLWYLPLLIMVVFRPRLDHLSSPEVAPVLVGLKRDPVKPSRTTPGRVDQIHLFR